MLQMGATEGQEEVEEEEEEEDYQRKNDLTQNSRHIVWYN
jgi:hypothetical protein